jgi:hypothetical protein
MISPTDLFHPSPAPHFKTFQAEKHDEGTRGFREYTNLPNIPNTLIRIRNPDKITEPTYTVSYGFSGDKTTNTLVTG